MGGSGANLGLSGGLSARASGVENGRVDYDGPSIARLAASLVTHRILPGEYMTTADEDGTLYTILGSCVAACVRNPLTGFGGLNHFMLPESEIGAWEAHASSTRYGNFAMDALIRDVVASGCALSDLEVKLFGGADLYRSSQSVGSRNIQFAIDYLSRLGITPLAQDLGGHSARKIFYQPATGRVVRCILPTGSDGIPHR